MNKLILSTLLLAPSASAFFQQKPKVATPAASAPSINGWVADESQFAYGLPGSLDPVPEFDPLGFTKKADLMRIKTLREAERDFLIKLITSHVISPTNFVSLNREGRVA